MPTTVLRAPRILRPCDGPDIMLNQNLQKDTEGLAITFIEIIMYLLPFIECLLSRQVDSNKDEIFWRLLLKSLHFCKIHDKIHFFNFQTFC